VARKSCQFEAGIDYSERYDIGELYIPTLLFRTRIGEIAEARININYEPQKVSFISYNYRNSVTVLGLGGKVKICKERGLLPETAFIGNGFYPVEKVEDAYVSHAGFDAYLAMQNHFGKHLSLNYNIGYIYFNASLPYAFSYSLSPAFQLTKKWSVFAEAFAFSAEFENFEHGFDGGIIFWAWENTQIDFSYIHNVTREGDYTFWALGFSMRLGGRL
jgi:hypothetical protein